MISISTYTVCKDKNVDFFLKNNRNLTWKIHIINLKILISNGDTCPVVVGRCCSHQIKNTKCAAGFNVTKCDCFSHLLQTVYKVRYLRAVNLHRRETIGSNFLFEHVLVNRIRKSS